MPIPYPGWKMDNCQICGGLCVAPEHWPKPRKPRAPKPVIDFGAPDPYVEWHVIDRPPTEASSGVDEPDHALTHRAVAAGTAYVVEATVRAEIVKHRIVTEDTIGEDE